MISQAEFVNFGTGFALLTDKAECVDFYQIVEMGSESNKLVLTNSAMMDFAPQYHMVNRKLLSTAGQKCPQDKYGQDVKMFKFRYEQETAMHQLMTMSSDNNLKIQKVDQEFIKLFNSSPFSMNSDLTQYQTSSPQISESNANQKEGLIFTAQPTHTEAFLSEFSLISDFNKVIFDTKEVDPLNDTILKSMRVRLVIGEQILSLFIRLPLDYPREPLSFSYGNLKNVIELNAHHAINLANTKASDKAKGGV